MLKKTIMSIVFAALAVTALAQDKYVRPSYIRAEGWPAHVHLKWDGQHGFDYNIYRYDGARYVWVASSDGFEYMDFGVGKDEAARTVVYRICPVGMDPDSVEAAEFQVACEVPAATDELLLDMVQAYTIRYFSDFAEPATGMARERSNNLNGDIVTTGGTGFGIMCLIVGANRGFIPESEAVGIIGKIVTFLENAERFHGAWAHWYDADTSKPFSFSKYDDGGDLVETAFLAAGLLTARQWLKENSRDKALAERCDKLWDGIEWSWYTQGSDDALYWHWSKNYGWKMNHRIKGFDETLITYVLAASSDDWAISKNLYEKSYKNSDYYVNDNSYFGVPIIIGMPYGGPLFFTHYSFLGLRPEGLEDDRTDYYERNRNHCLIHYRYAIENPKGHKGLGEELWGFTSSDDPFVGYTSHHPMTGDENGTVSPTAAVSSIVYTPEESMKVIRHLYYDLGEDVFGKYGFYDAYNPSLCEGQRTVKSYLAIDQGPQPVMIENYRSGMIWDYFMSCKEVRRGLDKLGFKHKK